MNKIKAVISIASLLAIGATDVAPGMDPNNPTCPRYPNWSSNRQMQLTPVDRQGTKILLAEGAIDEGLPERLSKVLAENPDISEIWLRSPGGVARAGNEAGRAIRKADASIITRIPKGWTCFSACNFVFMGGRARIVEAGGHFMVHMFTMTGDRDAINYSIEMGTESTVGLIGAVEQESALLATEDNDFLIRMGVSRKLLSEVMYRTQAVKSDADDKATRRCLTQKEAIDYNVANVSG
jgi:hypothetical protein